ncbi:MAG TPA: EAL domain-containing protein [Ilumatobacter sp.]|nr:EAL domain-containing protein [Ilumatobacter sp.]
MTGSLGLNPVLLQAAFPFHFAVDRDLIVVQHGPSLQRLLSETLIGGPMSDLFEIDTPKVPLTFDALARSPRSLFVLRSRTRSDLALRGQILHDDQLDVLFFVGSPWVTSTSAFGALGLTLSDFATSDAVVDYVLLLQNQATALAEAQALTDQLAHRACHDELTGLANRSFVLDQLQRELDPARGEQHTIAVLMLDLDGFKNVNDSYGHTVGDEVLRVVADRLREVPREGDTVARFGGDEFTILLHAPGSTLSELNESARCVAKRVLESIREPFALPSCDAVSVHLAASIGIAVGEAGDRAEDVIRNADLAMYAAKNNGKGRVEHYVAEMHTISVRRLDIASQLRDAIEHQEFRLLYQPVLRLEGNRFAGAEAVLRWQHPSRGLLAPDQFLDIAEESGLIVPIGAWVVQEACRELRHWVDAHNGLEPLGVAINLSARQLEADIVNTVREAIRANRLDPAAITIEITEGLISTDRPEAHDTIRALKDLGTWLAIDDFGTGHSSLGRLRDVEFDELKIDRRFVSDINTGDTTLVGAQVAMARGLGLNVVAEGVETAAELEYLREIGCQQVQGFLIARPLTSCDVRAVLAGPGVWTDPNERRLLAVRSTA